MNTEERMMVREAARQTDEAQADMSPRIIALQMLRQRVHELDVRIHAHHVEEAKYHRKTDLVRAYEAEPEPPAVDSIDREVDYRVSDRAAQRLLQKRDDLILAMTIINSYNDL